MMKRTATAIALALAMVMSVGAAGYGDDHDGDEETALEYAVARGWLQAGEDGALRPDQAVPAGQVPDIVGAAFPQQATRADLATYVWGGSQAIVAWTADITPNSFPDVADDHPQLTDIDNLAAKSLLLGYPDGNFRPERAVTASQTAKVLNRFLGELTDGITRAQLADFMREGNRALLERNRPPARSDQPAYTRHFVQQAIDRYRDQGRQAAFDFYNSADSVDGQWYVFIIEDEDTVVHPTRPELRGSSPTHRTGVYGKPYGLELVAADEDGVWVDYVFLNAATGQNRQKHTWAVLHDDLIFASGWYEDQVPAPPAKDEPAAYTQYFVQQAVDRFRETGRQATIDFYNSTDSIDGPWYIFIIEDGTTISIATNPELVGTATTTRTDVNGKNYGRELAAADERGAWVDYIRRNPDSGELEQKHSWVLKRDGLIFGSGWYEPAGG